MRDVGPHLLVDLDEASSTATPAASGPTILPLGRRPTATSRRSNRSFEIPSGPSNVTRRPSASAATAVTFVISRMFSYRLAIRFISGATILVGARDDLVHQFDDCHLDP
jgi:hypothetical protein